MRPNRLRRLTLMAALLAIVILAAAGAGPGVSRAATAQSTPSDGTPTDVNVPVLAYYYIWFDPQSWDRAKSDYPTLGRYSSDDPAIMRQHIQWAKDAGIDGFIVSWKNTDRLSARLKRLVSIAEDENFKSRVRDAEPGRARPR